MKLGIKTSEFYVTLIAMCLIAALDAIREAGVALPAWGIAATAAVYVSLRTILKLYGAPKLPPEEPPKDPTGTGGGA